LSSSIRAISANDRGGPKNQDVARWPLVGNKVGRDLHRGGFAINVRRKNAADSLLGGVIRLIVAGFEGQ
jgi:hypothetical protein